MASQSSCKVTQVPATSHDVDQQRDACAALFDSHIPRKDEARGPISNVQSKADHIRNNCLPFVWSAYKRLEVRLIEFKTHLRKSNSKRYNVATLMPMHCAAHTWRLMPESGLVPHVQKLMLSPFFHRLDPHDTSTPIPSEICEQQSFLLSQLLSATHTLLGKGFILLHFSLTLTLS
jgi:hypothetical protein